MDNKSINSPHKDDDQNKLIDDVIEGQVKALKTKKRSKAWRRLAEFGLMFLELIKVIVLAAITIVLIRHFLFKPFYVRGASMEPTFYDKEYLIIDELTYRFREPNRGEVIVFRYPDDRKEFFLKRIVGLPGERIKIAGGEVKVYNQEYPEGIVLDEKYIKDSVSTLGDNTIDIKEDGYFVLGDNRFNSFDSRKFGTIDKEDLVGRAVFRGWPIGRVQILKSPDKSA